MILMFDSSAMQVSMVLYDGDKRYAYQWEAGRALAKDMLAYLRDRLSEHGASFESLTGLGVYAGPGSYTGLRIGITVLNTLAESQNIPIVGATGSDWQAACLRRLAASESDKIVLPEYGGEAHVTKQRK